MDTNCKSRLSQFWNHLQHELFPFLREEDHLALSPALEQVIRVLEFTQIERFIPSMTYTSPLLSVSTTRGAMAAYLLSM